MRKIKGGRVYDSSDGIMTIRREGILCLFSVSRDDVFNSQSILLIEIFFDFLTSTGRDF